MSACSLPFDRALLWRDARHDRGTPPWVTKLLDRFGLINLATVQQKMADRGSMFCQSLHHYRPNQIRGHHQTFSSCCICMLYLLFFLLSDREEALSAG
jgi:hypothetical protein